MFSTVNYFVVPQEDVMSLYSLLTYFLL